MIYMPPWLGKYFWENFDFNETRLTISLTLTLPKFLDFLFFFVFYLLFFLRLSEDHLMVLFSHGRPTYQRKWSALVVVSWSNSCSCHFSKAFTAFTASFKIFSIFNSVLLEIMEINLEVLLKNNLCSSLMPVSSSSSLNLLKSDFDLWFMESRMPSVLSKSSSGSSFLISCNFFF